MKKTALWALVVGVLLSMSSCDRKALDDQKIGMTDTDSKERSELVKDETYYTSKLSTENYDGYTYRMLVRSGRSKYQYMEEPQEDVVDDAIYRRNKAVEQRFGITLSCTESNESNTDISALNSILAGDDAYDLILTHSHSAFAYANQGAACNINDISSIHIDQPWWTRDLARSCNVNGNLFVLGGDFSINALSQAMCLFFNKNIFDELGFEYPYETVKEGNWTFDEFAYLAKRGGADLNGDGVLTPGTDQFGFVSLEWYSPVNILYAGGQRIYSIGEDGFAELSYYSNKTVEIIDEFFSLMRSNACLIQFNDAASVVSFDSGEAMFMDGGLGNAAQFRNMSDDFGILPYPKFDEADEYHTAFNAVADMGLIPITVEDIERTGAITEALCAYGSMYVLPAFYDVSLKTKASRDDESEAMMDIIRDGLVYDIGYLSGASALSPRNFLHASSINVASDYESKESSERKKVEEFNAGYGKKQTALTEKN